MSIYYIWYNVDGDVSIYSSWEDLWNSKEYSAFDYLSSYKDSLDYAEVEFIIEGKSLNESKGRAFCILDPFSKTAKEWFTNNKKKIKYLNIMKIFLKVM